ncbi:MAG: hypothetical protein WC761_05130 [Candidatus Paceibacterota bacterium]|jgi:hypothetical protein
MKRNLLILILIFLTSSAFGQSPDSDPLQEKLQEMSRIGSSYYQVPWALVSSFCVVVVGAGIVAFVRERE